MSNSFSLKYIGIVPNMDGIIYDTNICTQVLCSIVPGKDKTTYWKKYPPQSRNFRTRKELQNTYYVFET